MWSKSFAEVQAPKMDGEVRKAMEDIIEVSPTDFDYHSLKKNFLVDYTGSYTEAMEAYKAAEDTAVEQREWFKADEAKVLIEELFTFAPPTIEKSFPPNLDEVQDGSLQQTLDAVACLKKGLKVDELECEKFIRELLSATGKKL